MLGLDSTRFPNGREAGVIIDAPSLDRIPAIGRQVVARIVALSLDQIL